MRIAISNIAWDVPEDEAVAALLARDAIDAIDVAPSKYFADPPATTREDAGRVRDWWAGRGIELTGMQALLFGTTGLNLFGERPSSEAMLERLGVICRIGGWLGARRLVFGSPKNRDRTGLTDAEAADRAVGFFRRVGDLAAEAGVQVCIEPNPVRYGCNFMTTTAEAAAIVRAVGHPAIRLHLDAGTIAINAEDPAEAVASNRDIIGHVHASEPELAVLGEGGAPHRELAAALRSSLPDVVVSIEMVAARAEPHVAAIERALGVARQAYGDSGVTKGAVR